MKKSAAWLWMLVMAFPAWAQENTTVPSLPVAGASPAGAVKTPAVLTSLFFSDTERDAIAQARQEYQERLQNGPSEADLLDQLNGIKESQVPEEALEEKQYEQFYLESLMYHTPSDWTLWIRSIHGSDKYAPDTAQDPKGNFQLIAISKESATFEWKPRNWPYVAKKFVPGNSNITLNAMKKTVTFTLWVNQTLQSHNMSVVEGFAPVVPIADANAPTAAVTKPLQESPAKNIIPAAPAAITPQQPGILDQYKTLEGFDKKRP